MDVNLEGRVAVVTGASSGIGESTARALAGAGARVALVARRRERIERLARELDPGARRVRCYPLDVTDAAAVRDLAARVERDLGRTDCLVNNAGVMLLGRFDQQDPSEWRRMVELNVTAVFETTRAFLDQLTAGGGDIVNVSSVAGRKVRTTTSVYSATKWAMNGFSEGLRLELARRGVRVIVVEPGIVRTELQDHITDPTIREEMARRAEAVEALTANDIAEIILFAVSRPRRVSINEVLVRPTLQEY